MRFLIGGGVVTLQDKDTVLRFTVEEFQSLEEDFEYTPGSVESWEPDRQYLTVDNNQQASPYDRSKYLTAEKLAQYAVQLAALREPTPDPNPGPTRLWGELASRMNANIDWLRLVKGNGAAAELARYVSLRDIENARAYWLFLDSEGDLSESLKEEIEAAAEACNLSDLLAQITGNPV